MTKPIIFLGPSLSRMEARSILDADYRPPLRIGDLDSVGSQSVVGIIDGVLGAARLPMAQVQSAIDRGIKFFGAASTGAFLANQLGASGIVGLGRVFAFLSQFNGDGKDLITSLYAEHDNVLLTIPLINIVLAYPDLPHEDAATLAASLCEIPIERRTLECISHRISGLRPPLAGLRRLRPADLCAKSDDALLLLRHLKTMVTPESASCLPLPD